MRAIREFWAEGIPTRSASGGVSTIWVDNRGLASHSTMTKSGGTA